MVNIPFFDNDLIVFDLILSSVRGNIMDAHAKGIYLNLTLHLLIWTLVAILLFIYPSYRYNTGEIPGDFVVKQIVHFILMVAAYYLNAYILVPKLILRHKYFMHALTIAVIMISAGFIMAGVDEMLDLKTKMFGIWFKNNEKSYFDRFGFATTVITLGISTSISLINRVNKDNKALLRLEKEKATMELSALKAQVHPHFLFNTLNTIYALSYNEAEASRNALAKLSKILRYNLYETVQNITSFDSELAFLKNYIDIMRLRLNANTTLDFMYPEETVSMQIVPMLLIPFVENVFKHGINESDDNRLFIRIRQGISGIQLTTINSFYAQNNRSKNRAAGGIGIQNTLRRLELLYKDKYELNIQPDEAAHKFVLNLKIELV